MIQFKVSDGTAGNSDLPERYDDLPKHNIEVFQSENIQNILDAKSKSDDNVEVEYEIVPLKKEERNNLKEKLMSNFISKLKESFNQSKSQDIKDQVKKINFALENEEKWMSLIVKEKNTTGLTGDEIGRKSSRYHALLRAINRSEQSGISGGTFGKGSSVYTFSSGLWMWFAYSVLEEPWEDTKVRFAGRGLIAPFVDYDNLKSYHGPVWYARNEKSQKKHYGLPFINDDAHQRAEEFNIPLRNDADKGTT